MEPGKNPLPARDQASKIAAACGGIPLEDLGKKLHPLEEEVPNPDLDRALDELGEPCGTKQPTDKMAVQVPDIASTPMGDEEEMEGASGHYECPECGHVNPGENQFCGMCAAAHDETMTAPARRITEGGFVDLNVTASSGIKHFHHHYHHKHYRSSPYLMLSIVALLAVLAWHAGWEYGLRANMPQPATLPVAGKAQPASAEAEDRKREAPPAVAKETPPRRRLPHVRSAPPRPAGAATRNAPSDTPAQAGTPTRE